MFGPGVDEAIKTYRNAPEDPDLAGLLALFGSTEAVVPRWRRQGDDVIGMEEDGTEIIRVPTREPLRVIQGYDSRLGCVRSNCP